MNGWNAKAKWTEKFAVLSAPHNPNGKRLAGSRNLCMQSVVPRKRMSCCSDKMRCPSPRHEATRPARKAFWLLEGFPRQLPAKAPSWIFPPSDLQRVGQVLGHWPLPLEGRPCRSRPTTRDHRCFRVCSSSPATACPDLMAWERFFMGRCG